ncbi:MAG: hypothetical protein ACTHJT_12785, partial [Cytophaga sp.]|uniref:hypothetical protein n=1 Tax=Cytophaga sp. TaxID=29535 RepID=UPI003F7D7FD9
KKRSVYASRAYSSKMLGFILNKELLLSHAPQLDGFSEHEDGYSSPLLFDTIQHKFVNDLSRLGLYPSFPDSFELDIKDWSHVEMFFPGTKQRDAYRKVSNVNDALRGILFAGNYRMDAHDVSFDKTGAVTGFADYQFYEPIYDFGEGIDYDAIVLYKDRHAGNLMDGDIYTFNFNADTLYLSHVETDWDKMEHKVSTEKIKLIKQ